MAARPNPSELIADAHRVRERGREVGALYERGLTWVQVHPLSGPRCHIDYLVRRFPGLGLISGSLCGVRHQRAAEHMDDGNDDFSLHLNLAGTSVVSGRGRQIALHDRSAILLNYAESRAICRPGPVRYQIVRVPREALRMAAPRITDEILRPIPDGTGALRLLTHYVDAIIGDPALTQPELRATVTAHLCDLIAATVVGPRSGEESKGVSVARLRAVKDDIVGHLGDAGLAPAQVAGRQRISESYIRKLFAAEGTSFSEFVLTERLAQARRMLSSPRLHDRSIASVAFDCGFGDLSHFNRTFRRNFGLTPSEVKEAAREALVR